MGDPAPRACACCGEPWTPGVGQACGCVWSAGRVYEGVCRAHVACADALFRYPLGHRVQWQGAWYTIVRRRYEEGTVSRWCAYGLWRGSPESAATVVWAYEADLRAEGEREGG